MHITGAFSARNRFELLNPPEKLHAREPVLMELGILPLGAITGAGQSTVVRASTNSAFANCSVARVSGSSSMVPAEALWAQVNNTASVLLTISSANAFLLWVRCWQHTVTSAGIHVEGAVKPQFKFEYSSGIAFLPSFSAEFEVVYIDCGMMSKMTHGNIVYEDNGFGSMAFLARATAYCETGYDLVTYLGNVVTCAMPPCTWSTVCQATGWSQTAPTCIIHNCGTTPVADNKTASGPVSAATGDDGGKTTYGAVLTYGCVEGFEPTSTTTSLRCTATGWSQSTVPTCTPVTCPALTAGANTLQPIYSTNPNGMPRYLSVATYECLPGHTLSSGSLTATCRADRTWSGSLPVCRTNMCLLISHETASQKPISFTLNDKATTVDKTTGFFFVGTIAEYSCADGYSWIDPTASHTRTCVYNEGWLPIAAPRCQPVSCPSLESIFHGSIKQEPAELLNLYGVTATYTCDYGATIIPQGNSIMCNANGTWSSVPRTCQPYQCPTPAAFVSGQVQEIITGSNGQFSNNSIIEYRCNAGQNLIYPGVNLDTKYFVSLITSTGVTIEVGRRECTPSGWFPTTLPQCRINECSALAGTSNVASISYFNVNGAPTPQYGTVATYACSPGYETRDSSDNIVDNTRLCGSRDQGWLPIDPPRCLPIDCGKVSNTVINNGLPIELTWDELAVKGPTRLGATVTYTCELGFAFVNGNGSFTRSCSATRQWVPAEPTCSDINECNPAAFNGKYFVNCTQLHGAHSQCINTFGSYICIPTVTTTPYLPYAPSGGASFNALENVFTPSNTAGGQHIKFAVRSGAGLVEPYFNRVRYMNPDKALYDDPLWLQYECTNVQVTVATTAARAAVGFDYYDVSCKLSPGQGEGLFVSVQYCVAVHDSDTPDCSRWNWDWQGTRSALDIEQVPINKRLRVTYPMTAFVPRSLQSVTVNGLTQMTSDYVSQTSLGEDIIMSLGNFYLDRPQLISIYYGEAKTETDFLYICDFNYNLAVRYSNYALVVACHTQDRVNLIDLRFRLCIAGRCTVSTDMYSYPQIPEVTAVYGCAIDDLINGRTYGCPTDGSNVRLTVTGSGFLEPLTTIISGRQCESLERANNTYFTCLLPVSAGEALTVTVKAGSQRTDSRNRLSYAGPTITGIRGCEPVSDVYIRECNRLGGNRIELTGQNFGASGSNIMVGGQTCYNVIHDSMRPHERVTCVTPSGFASERTVTLLQRYGTMSLQNILLSYVQCPPGQFSVDILCMSCKVGNFNDLWSQSARRQCAPGLYANTTGSISCSVCPAGQYSVLGAGSCKVCPRGSFSGARSGSCSQCPPGTFAQYEGSSVCEACPLGAESNEDYTFCRCSVGTYMDVNGTCVDCMLGGDCTSPGTTIYNIESLQGYAPAVIRYERDSVVRMQIYVSTNSTNDDARKISRATVIKLLYDNTELPLERILLVDLEFSTVDKINVALMATNNIIESSSGKISTARFSSNNNNNNSNSSNDSKNSRFTASSNDAVIISAPHGLVAIVDVDVYPSASGAYTLENSSDALYQSMVDQINKNAASMLSTNGVAVLTGAGIARNSEFKRYATPSFELCINNACRGKNVCLEGHTGNLCAVCLPGYGKTSSFECARCNSPALRTFLLVLAVVGAIAICTVLVWKQIVDGKQSMNELPAPAVPLLLKVATSGLQVMSIAARYDLQWPGFLADVFETADTAGGVGTAFLSLDCFLADDPIVHPFWVTTISIMVLPLAGVLLPAIVFVPMYFSTRRRYRRELIAQAVEERALSAEVVLELKANQKRDRGEKLKQRRAEAERENKLVWELVDEKVGILIKDAPTLDSTPKKATAQSTHNVNSTKCGASLVPTTARTLQHGGYVSKSSLQRTKSSSVGDGDSNTRTVSGGKRRRVISKLRTVSSVGDAERFPLPPPILPPAHIYADQDEADEECDNNLSEFENMHVAASETMCGSKPTPTANNFDTGSGATKLQSRYASPVFGAVTILDESLSHLPTSPGRDSQRQALLAAKANAPFMRPSLRWPTTTTIKTAVRSNSPLTQQQQLQQLPHQRQSPSVKPFLHPQQHYYPHSLDVSRPDDDTSSISRPSAQGNAFSPNDEVSWRNERAMRASAHLTTLSSCASTADINQCKTSNLVVNPLALRTNNVASVDSIAPEPEFEPNVYADTRNEDSHDDGKDGGVNANSSPSTIMDSDDADGLHIPSSIIEHDENNEHSMSGNGDASHRARKTVSSSDNHESFATPVMLQVRQPEEEPAASTTQFSNTRIIVPC